MAVEIIDAKGTIWPLPLSEVRNIRLNQEVFGTPHTAKLMNWQGYPIEVALAILTRRPA
jgi:hypothetical protein